jgi:hypothetical protein
LRHDVHVLKQPSAVDAVNVLLGLPQAVHAASLRSQVPPYYARLGGAMRLGAAAAAAQ